MTSVSSLPPGAPDLVKVLKGIGEEGDDELVDAMLSSVDVDGAKPEHGHERCAYSSERHAGDGQISYAEFRGLVKLLEQERGG